MNRSFNHFPWFLVVTLASFTACGNLFTQSLCDYSGGLTGCPDMSNDGMLSRARDLAPLRVKGNQVGFSLIAESPLSATRRWVGVRPGGQLAFVEQNGIDGNIKRLALVPKLAPATGWELKDAKAGTCLNCLTTIAGFDISQDYLVGGNSLFFAVKTGLNGHIEAYPENNISSKTHQSGDFLDYRPFSHPNMDIILYQRQVIRDPKTGPDAGKSTSKTGISFSVLANNSATIEELFAERIDLTTSPDFLPNYTSYTFGNLDDGNQTFENNQVYIFQNNNLAGAYRITKNTVNPVPDLTLTTSVNSYLATDGDIGKKIRGVFIADLNNDGYMELIYGRGTNIYIGTYDPERPEPFIKWNKPINISTRISGSAMDISDRPHAISVADLNGDGYLDLAVEIVQDNSKDYTNEPLKRVSIYLNNKN